MVTIESLEAQIATLKAQAKSAAPASLKLDLGCGTKKTEGFVGVDERAFPGVDVVCDIGVSAWPWPDNSVEEVRCSHTVEHLTASQRIHFANELFRVLKPGATALITTPHWASCRAYGDLTHQWPPVSEMWFGYLNTTWRAANAPHNDTYTCDFEYPPTIGYAPHPSLIGRNQEFVQEALRDHKEAAQDMQATLRKAL